MSIRSAEGFECPDCDAAFSEQQMMDALSEPFNGVCVTCESCNKEFLVQVGFKIEPV